jgi:hypothetical protein
MEEYYNLYPEKFQGEFKQDIFNLLENWIDNDPKRKDLLDKIFSKPEFYPIFKVSDQSSFAWKLIGRHGYLIAPSESSKGFFKYIMLNGNQSYVKIKFKIEENGNFIIFDKHHEEVETFEDYEAFRKHIFEKISIQKIDLEINSPRFTFFYNAIMNACSKVKSEFSIFLFNKYFTPNQNSIEITLAKDQTVVFFNFDILIQWSITLRNLAEDFNTSIIKDVEIPNATFSGFVIYVALKMNPSKSMLLIPQDLLKGFNISEKFNLTFIFQNILSVYHVANYLGDDQLICELLILIKDNYKEVDKFEIQKLLDVIQF